MTLHPVLFVAHGAPLLALDLEKGEALYRWASRLPKPRSILVVSAHWERSPPSVGTFDHSKLLYDFSGFPPELYRLEYPAPGAPELAQRVAELLHPRYGEIGQVANRPLDHGAWVPLRWLYPTADIPVLQLSLPRRATPQEIVAFGECLAPLRAEQVLILASGVLTHNLGAMDFAEDAPAPAWAQAFDAWCERALLEWRVEELTNFRAHRADAQIAHPSDEHYTPLLVAVGAANKGSHVVSFPITGFEFGSISRRCVQID